MKTTLLLAGLSTWASVAFAQVEQDDMYFNKKDRAKWNKEINNSASARLDSYQDPTNPARPLRFDYPVTRASQPVADNTSSHKLNPEYVARTSSSNIATTEEESYFVDNYQYNSQNQLKGFNNNLNTWNSSPMYSNNYFSPSINSWNSPYYSPYNDPFLTGYNSNPWRNSAFGNGWSVAFSYGFGNAWNYGYPYNSYNFGMNWGHPFNCLNYGYGNSMWNNSYYGGYGYYPSTIIVVDNHRNAVYGKRGSRGQETGNPYFSNSPGSRSSITRITQQNNTNGMVTNGSRSAASRSSQEYYTPQWRRVTQQPASRDSYNGGNSNTGSDRSNSSRSSGFNDFFRNMQPAGSTQRSDFNSPSRSDFSTPSRSSSSTPSHGSSGGGGGSRTRGRDN